jgi:hypothetical protein
MRKTLALIAVTAATTWTAGPAGAVHQSHHGPFVGRTSQGERLVMRTTSHTRIGIRFRWSGNCELGGRVLRIARFRNVPVDANGRFFLHRLGVRLRGKIGFDPMGNPAFPAPFSFANNEAKGRFRASPEFGGKGICRSGLVTWEASR